MTRGAGERAVAARRGSAPKPLTGGAADDDDAVAPSQSAWRHPTSAPARGCSYSEDVFRGAYEEEDASSGAHYDDSRLDVLEEDEEEESRGSPNDPRSATPTPSECDSCDEQGEEGSPRSRFVSNATVVDSIEDSEASRPPPPLEEEEEEEDAVEVAESRAAAATDSSSNSSEEREAPCAASVQAHTLHSVFLTCEEPLRRAYTGAASQLSDSRFQLKRVGETAVWALDQNES